MAACSSRHLTCSGLLIHSAGSSRHLRGSGTAWHDPPLHCPEHLVAFRDELTTEQGLVDLDRELGVGAKPGRDSSRQSRGSLLGGRYLDLDAEDDDLDFELEDEDAWELEDEAEGMAAHEGGARRNTGAALKAAGRGSSKKGKPSR
jgi:hypothetical protein